MDPTETTRAGGFIHDPRHRYSLELRPAEALDAHLRLVATQLEESGLIPVGASTATRFHPHVTLLRSATAPVRAATEVARVLHDAGAIVHLTSAATFGDGRIIHVGPADRAPLDAARVAGIELVDPAELDPLVTARPWTPHVTLAYAVPPEARPEALAQVVAALPIHGRWASVEVWDLDVRPTHCVERVHVPPPG